jgi:hypothetical protein
MIKEQSILAAERLRDDLTNFKATVRKRYSASSQVTSDDIRQQAADLAEIWLVELATDDAVKAAIDEAALADLSVHFQRILTFSEHATIRSRYDTELRNILQNYSMGVVLPLKQSRGKAVVVEREQTTRVPTGSSVFVGQSFVSADAKVNQCVFDVLTGMGLSVVTGEKPKADRISEKVKALIEQQSIFLGIFTRRDKIARKSEWTTSAWVIDEKAYALGRQKPLILLKEQGVNSIGGIQGDYEYIEFSRDALEIIAVKLISLFNLTNNGLRK